MPRKTEIHTLQKSPVGIDMFQIYILVLIYWPPICKPCTSFQGGQGFCGNHKSNIVGKSGADSAEE